MPLGCALAGRLRSVSTNEQPERLSAEEVRRVATLCHVGVSDAEVEELLQYLSLPMWVVSPD